MRKTGGVSEHVPDRLKTTDLCRLSQYHGCAIASAPRNMLAPELREPAAHTDRQALGALTEILVRPGGLTRTHVNATIHREHDNA